ncbi:MAG TPA: TPM domain-containing protein [Gemmatimonadales bacterium]|nr:TPM domain-containing protein [Gemmatimonadales bacterium]
MLVNLTPRCGEALILLAVLLQISIPPPHGFVNDFAGVLDAASVRHMEAVIAEVREKTRGEIAVVTLPDIGNRSASDVALQIGRQWGVGAKADPGDRSKNLGVVVLLVPRKNHRPGTGDVFISTGRGAEGFLTDARAGSIRDAMLPALGAEEYGKGLALGVDLIAQAFATEFAVTLTNPEYAMPPVARDNRREVTIPFGWLIAILILLIILSRGRILWIPFWILSQGRGGWGGGGSWSGGGGGGGFGGFGGGGGFSGGGAGGRF